MDLACMAYRPPRGSNAGPNPESIRDFAENNMGTARVDSYRFENRPSDGLACIAHKSLEIFERCRLRQRHSPAKPENRVALFWVKNLKQCVLVRLFPILLLNRRGASD
jgi:hypothetical protein